MKNQTYRLLGATLAAATLVGVLVACGGGGDGADGGAATPVAQADALVPGSEVPVGATTSADGALSFTQSVAAVARDSSEPLVLGDAVLASSDTAEPSDI